MTEPHVRPARSADLESFAAVLGDREFFDDRFERQRKGDGKLFLAWLGPQPAGAVYLWLEEAEEPAIRDHLPHVPLITHLAVHRGLRRNGVGTALVDAAERCLVEQGFDRVALAVQTDNRYAAGLYEKLEYRDWGFGEVTCYARTTLPDGTVLIEPERCYVRVKNLIPVTPAPRTEAWSVGASHPG
ncbi:GNAT family N-acetyltransferase [Amycolatopsis sp. NPDC051045]|uniref:GNAT family N-acetyltransferase n=1 Tax=Amycolatopsis sp. NPDC051045 TaxID=3156922 RepID=UPI003427854E